MRYQANLNINGSNWGEMVYPSRNVAVGTGCDIIQSGQFSFGFPNSSSVLLSYQKGSAPQLLICKYALGGGAEASFYYGHPQNLNGVLKYTKYWSSLPSDFFGCTSSNREDCSLGLA